MSGQWPAASLSVCPSRFVSISDTVSRKTTIPERRVFSARVYPSRAK